MMGRGRARGTWLGLCWDNQLLMVPYSKLDISFPPSVMHLVLGIQVLTSLRLGSQGIDRGNSYGEIEVSTL
jgi:hypothetical protein